MMKTLNTRLQQRHDIPANWEKSKIIPLAGEIIVYDDRYIDSNHNVVVVAPMIRYKIGDGVTPVNALPFADTAKLANEVQEIYKRLEGLEEKGTSTLTPVDGTIVFTDKPDGGKLIGVAIAPVAGNALVAVEGGLFVPAVKAPEYTEGDGIEITENKISIKLADTTHGLVAVNGALRINLATKTSDGAMSKEDKAFIDAIPDIYVPRKYEVTHKPKGTLVDYREKEIRIMCPADTKWNKQTSGTGSDPNSYYIGFKAYAPSEAVSFKEDTKEVIEDNTMHYFENNSFAGIDSKGRRYSIIWLPTARLVNDTWTYYGAKSSEDKYVGWHYSVAWFNADGAMIESDTIRINLSNESCHNNDKPYFMAEYATSSEVEELKETVENGFSWGDI